MRKGTQVSTVIAVATLAASLVGLVVAAKPAAAATLPRRASRIRKWRRCVNR